MERDLGWRVSEPEGRVGSLETAVSSLLVEIAEGRVRGASLLCFTFALMLCDVPHPAPTQTSVKCATHACVWCFGACRDRVLLAGDLENSNSLRVTRKLRVRGGRKLESSGEHWGLEVVEGEDLPSPEMASLCVLNLLFEGCI